MNKPTIQDLIAHLKNYKDAVVIIGDKIHPEIGKRMEVVKEDEESEQEKLFTRKSMVKNPNSFWEYYFNNMYYDNDEFPDIYDEIKSIKDKHEIAKLIISTDIRHQAMRASDMDLRGTSTIIECSKCGAILTDKGILEMKDSKNYKCPQCKGRLRPNCLLYGENYSPIKVGMLTDAIFKSEEGKEVVPNTHTLILIGVDMQEDLISEMYDNYLLVRERTQEPCYIVMVTDNEADVKLFTPEFATTMDIEGATERLVNLFD